MFWGSLGWHASATSHGSFGHCLKWQTGGGLFKKRDERVCSNYRVITLLRPGKSVPGYWRGEFNWLVKLLIQEDRYGFNLGHGTPYQLYTHHRVVEGWWEFPNQPRRVKHGVLCDGLYSVCKNGAGAWFTLQSACWTPYLRLKNDLHVFQRWWEISSIFVSWKELYMMKMWVRVSWSGGTSTEEGRISGNLPNHTGSILTLVALL